VKDKSKEIWVFAEHNGGKVHHAAFELLGKASELATATGGQVCAVLLGCGIEGLAKDLFARGAAKVYLVDDPQLADYRTEQHAEAARILAEKYKPNIFLFGATSTGRDLAPNLAARLKTGLTADCTGLDIEPHSHSLIQTRPAFGGNIMAKILCSKRRPQMATARPKVFAEPKPQPGKTGRIIRESVNLNVISAAKQVLEFIAETETVNIADADIIVAGGRGIGPSGFKMLQELADLLGGAVGASRAAVDAGWISVHHQIGQTGRTVRPRLYIACGISGAIQHLAGMRTSERVVAINIDPEAPIFNIANVGLIADVREVIPMIIKEVRRKVAK